MRNSLFALTLVSFSIVAGAPTAWSAPGLIFPEGLPRDKLVADERLLDPRNPLANYRARTEPGTAVRGSFENCPHDFDVLHYELNFDGLDEMDFALTGNTVVDLASTVANLASVDLDLTSQLTVSSIVQDGTTALTYSHSSDVLSIQLAAPADSGEVVSLDIAYSGVPWNEGGGGFGGFWFAVVPRNAFSMGVGLITEPPSMGRTWFPCYDWPCDKATAALNIEVPLNRMAIANGALASVDSTATAHTWHWSHEFPISTYLIAMSVAPYRVLADSIVTDPRITVYFHAGHREESEVSFQFVDLMMEALEARFGPYPFEKFAYMTTWLGDMEHQTCVSHSLTLVNGTNTYDDILSHEMTHMWFGDCVTYGDWRDTWLSEGFATYGEAVYREYKNGIADYHWYATNSFINPVITSGPLEGLYAPTQKWGTVAYEKGAAVLHMLRGVLDDDALFWQVLNDFHTNHAYGNAVTTDFLADVDATVGEDMSWFFDPWVYGSGHPIYEYGWSYDDLGGGQYQVDVVMRQTQSTGTLFDLPVDFRIGTSSGAFDFSARIDQWEEVVSFVVGAEPTSLLIDPEDWIADEQQLAPTSIDFGAEVASSQALQLLAPLPNPFTSRAEVRYYLPRAGDAAITIHDVSGRLVRALSRRFEEAGSRRIFWDGRSDQGEKVAPGVYWVRLHALDGEAARKVVMLR